jgi:SAM-dependent methyltransferase
MSAEAILRKVAEYYTAKVEDHGTTPRGVDWNSTESQELRFDQLLKVVEGPGPFSLNDYGCGYGALAAYLRRGGSNCLYRGFDISERMIEKARQQDAGPACYFTSNEPELTPADYTVASGIFNVKIDTPVAQWTAYVMDTLDRVSALSKRGFAFNVLTSYSDAERMRPDLYYADPCFLFDHCKRRFARRVAVLHDYKLYEFTMIVRKD